jgi:hypothetical protein
MGEDDGGRFPDEPTTTPAPDAGVPVTGMAVPVPRTSPEAMPELLGTRETIEEFVELLEAVIQHLKCSPDEDGRVDEQFTKRLAMWVRHLKTHLTDYAPPGGPHQS